MSTDGLTAPGSSEYSSNTMYVGDGTWDSERNTFLLPNLMGLNFDTMRYNGMGNRFRELKGYKSLVTGHAAVAAITFLAVIPLAIFMARFYHRNPRLALRMHIWLQILTVGLTTVVFVLGWFAVGPERSLTNPHHGIGLAIYVMVLVQAIGGGLIHHREKGRERFKIPLKLMMHQWLGRAIATLGFVQIPLGLTLWGSPKVFFILYALWGFFLLASYFFLSYRNLPIGAFDDDGSYVSDYRTEITDDRRSHRDHGRRFGALATAGAAGAGLAALRRRSQSRRGSRARSDHRTVLSSQPPSRHRSASRHHHEDTYVDEKYSEDGRDARTHTWRDRFLGATAGLGALAAVKNLLNRRKREQDSDVGSYAHPLGGPTSITQTDLSRVEEGRAPASPATPGDRYRRTQESEVAEDAAMTGSPVRRPRPRTRRSGDSISSYDSRASFESIRDGREGGGHGLRDGIAALGVVGFLKHKLGQRKNRKEERMVEEMRQRELENERVARMNSQRRPLAGDGPPPRRGGRRLSDGTESALDFGGSNPELSRHTLPKPVPMTTPTRAEMSSRINVVGEGSHPATGIPPPPHDPLPMPSGPRRHESSDSELYTTPKKHHKRRHSSRDAALAGAGAAVGGAAAGRSGSRQRPQSSDNSVTSPPVSVRVKMHKDGRHVTLQRLNEEEAAARREVRKRERKRAGSLSSASGDERWRRTERREAAEASEMREQQGRPTVTSQVPPSGPQTSVMQGQPLPGPPPGPPPMVKPQQQASPQSATNLPPPPAGLGSGLGSGLASPAGTAAYDTGTDMSNYDSNRRRRRAERAQARLARGGGTGSRVEFT